MKVIRNRLIPFGKNYLAVNLFGVVFSKAPLRPEQLNHEYIHTLQQREMLFLFFFLWYGVEWLFRIIQYRSVLKGYYHISMEKEAYEHEADLQYARHRRPYQWFRYLQPRRNLH